MCGIVGVYARTSRPVEEIVRSMSAEIVHRGPDDHGYFADGDVGLGIRRLSIIDLAGGHQPLSNETETHWIVFNGEIYNYRELRADLVARGHEFHTNSDTETIVHAFEEFGPDCVHRFNGMFAFAIWDKRARKLFIARDRLGVKPMYYYWDGTTLVFASEIKSILASGLVAKELEDASLWHYLTFRYVPAPLTIWRGVNKLPPAHRLTFDAETKRLEIERYWDIHYEAPREHLSDDEELEQFTELFMDSVRLRLIADVPVGIFLSGGLDSSAVAAAVHEVHSAPLNTFAIAFDTGGHYNELTYARQVAAHLGTRHHEMVIGRDEFVALLPDLVWHTDEPLADPAAIPLFYVSRLAAQRVKVVLSGEGADEVLAGYTFEQNVQAWERLARFQRWPLAVRSTLPDILLQITGSQRALQRLRRGNIPLARQNLSHLPYMTKFFTSAEKRELWPGAPDIVDSDTLIRCYYQQASTDEPLHQALYAFCQDWLVEDLLMKADKMTMATSIELRVPFLDYRLVEWLASRPPETKVRKNTAGRYVTKYLLRRFGLGRVPSAILHRGKRGFPVPIHDWIAGPLYETVTDKILASNSWVGAHFDRRYLEGLVQHGPASEVGTHRLWLLFVLEHWAQRWL